MASRDFYSTLGVTRGASADEIKKAYRRKARTLHPDQNKDNPGAEAAFKDVNEAYDVLKDPKKKSVYDQLGHEAFTSAGSGGQGFAQTAGGFSSAFSDVFDDLFGDIMGGQNRRGGQSQSRGSDLRYDITLDLEEAFEGVHKRITVTTSAACAACGGKGSEGGAEPVICPTCSGTGRVRAQQGFFTLERTCHACRGLGKVIRNPCTRCAGAGRVKKDQTIEVDIPAGVETGSRIRLGGRGEAGLRGGQPGDLYVFVSVREHETFVRDGQNLACTAPVSVTKAALGGDIHIPIVGGGQVKVRVPAGSQTGKRMRLTGKGMPSVRGSGRDRGDLYVDLFVETPVNLNDEQVRLLKKFEQLSDDDDRREGGLGERVKNLWRN